MIPKSTRREGENVCFRVEPLINFLSNIKVRPERPAVINQPQQDRNTEVLDTQLLPHTDDGATSNSGLYTHTNKCTHTNMNTHACTPQNTKNISYDNRFYLKLTDYRLQPHIQDFHSNTEISAWPNNWGLESAKWSSKTDPHVGLSKASCVLPTLLPPIIP